MTASPFRHHTLRLLLAFALCYALPVWGAEKILVAT